jgi:hypothetical protein
VNTRSPDLVPRFLPLVAGAALGTWGMRRGGWAGVAGALIGIGLLARGMTGHRLLVAPLASGRPTRAQQTGARENDDYATREAAVDEAVGRTFNRIALSDRAVFYITSAPPEGMRWLTRADAKEVDIEIAEGLIDLSAFLPAPPPVVEAPPSLQVPHKPVQRAPDR